MPANAVYVGRPTKWGNPYKVTVALDVGYASTIVEARELCVVAYRDWLIKGDFSKWWAGELDTWISVRRDLRLLEGRDLVCWCPLSVPCHADVLLELANG